MERRDLEIEKVEVNSPLICINVNLREFNQRDEKLFGLSEAAFKKLYLRHVRKKQL